MSGGWDKQSYALNIQMLFDASVRNGFDTLEAILKILPFFNIHKREAFKAGHLEPLLIQCRVSGTFKQDFLPKVCGSCIGP